MSSVVIVGAQWGDEGKGKVTDYLASKADMVVRYQGGGNAGHTVVIGSQEFRLHLIPSGIFYPDKTCVIGNGVVIDPEMLFQEIDDLAARGTNTGRLYISDRAHLALPFHQRLDEIEEEARGDRQIGTTKHGIGPAYVDKVARSGIRLSDVLAPGWEEYVSGLVNQKRMMLSRLYCMSGIDANEVVSWLAPYVERMRPFIADTSLIISQHLADDQKVLFEGAQGTFLDIDHGTYPFVTASSTTAGGACTGSGIGPTAIDTVLGVCKAYLTRVGEGPFPTELPGADGENLRLRGMEFGTTTGRPRRCGWLDLVQLRYAVRINGLSGLIITKLDVLDSLPKIRLCAAYRRGKEIFKEFPATLRVLQDCQPVYEDVDGWEQDTSRIRNYQDLPERARLFLERIRQATGVPVVMVSVGPEREQTFVMRDIIF